MKKILIIDDDRDLSFLLKSALDRSGYSTYISNDSKSGLQIAKTQQPDLILLDIRLPDMNGIRLAKSLQSHASTKAIPIIFLTAILSDEVGRLKKYGIMIGRKNYEVISKPVDFVSLMIAIKELTSEQQKKERAGGLFSIFNKKGSIWRKKGS